MAQPIVLLIIDILICALEFGALWGGHWFKWSTFPALVDETGQLHRVLAYVYGTGCIFVGLVLWSVARVLLSMATVSIWEPAIFLAFDILAAGLGTCLPRLLRLKDENNVLKGDVADYEQALRGRNV